MNRAISSFFFKKINNDNFIRNSQSIPIMFMWIIQINEMYAQQKAKLQVRTMRNCFDNYDGNYIA